MKKLQLILLFLPIIGFSQGNPNPCDYNNTIDNTTLVDGAVVGDYITGIAWSGDGHRLEGMESNKTYLISMCEPQVMSSFDFQITIYPAGGGQAVAWNDDGNCSYYENGTTVSKPKYPYIEFTPPYDGDYDILFDEYWNNYCQHFNDGVTDYHHYTFEVISVSTDIDENLPIEKKLIKTLNVLGKKSTIKNNTVLFYTYDDGTVEKRIVIQ